MCINPVFRGGDVLHIDCRYLSCVENMYAKVQASPILLSSPVTDEWASLHRTGEGPEKPVQKIHKSKIHNRANILHLYELHGNPRFFLATPLSQPVIGHLRGLEVLKSAMVASWDAKLAIFLVNTLRWPMTQAVIGHLREFAMVANWDDAKPEG